jgi:acyl carrier protein
MDKSAARAVDYLQISVIEKTSGTRLSYRKRICFARFRLKSRRRIRERIVNDERIREAIYRVVDETNEQLPKGRQLEKSPESILFGKGGHLDSLGLVGFIVEVEQKIEEEFAVSITLADERAMSQKNSPFLTLGALTAYVSLLIKEDEGTHRQ